MLLAYLIFLEYYLPMFKIRRSFAANPNSEYLLAAIQYAFIVGTNTPR